MKALIKTVLISVLLIGVCAPVYSQQGEKLFQQAMMKEQGEGKLDEAIDIYYRLVDDGAINRKIRAQALYQVGICYEKLGKKNAMSAYEQLIANFADQKPIAELARKKLKMLIGTPVEIASKGMISQRIGKDIADGIIINKISPNGRFYSYFESRFNADEIITYDLVTGKKDSVTTGNTTAYGVPNKIPWGSRWSPDGKKMTYKWSYFGAQERNEVHLIDSDGTNQQVLLSFKESAGFQDVHCFSPDGKRILYSQVRNENGQAEQVLVEVTIATKETNTIRIIGQLHGQHFSYSPNGKYIAYTKSQPESGAGDIYVIALDNNEDVQATYHNANDWDPVWSPESDQLLFFSSRLGTIDIYSMNFISGKIQGPAKSIKRNLGTKVKMMGVDETGALYYNAVNARRDVCTVDLDENMNPEPSSITTISNSQKTGGGLARYSKDGKYISFISSGIPYGDSNNSTSEANSFDPDMGDKYYIYVYDTNKKTSRLLNVDIYQNHWWRENKWHVPNWSYHGHKLIIHGRIKEQYTGGFFVYDIDTEKLTSVLTEPNCKHGTNYKRFGNSMFFSRKKNLIYYSAPDWKQAMQYNMATKEEKVIATINDGFWFEGFLDDQETTLYALNRFGQFSYDINTELKEKIGESSGPYFSGKSYDKKYKFLARGLNKDGENLGIEVVPVNKTTGSKILNLQSLFPESVVRFYDIHPKKNQLLLDVSQNSGIEIYKLTQIFE